MEDMTRRNFVLAAGSALGIVGLAACSNGTAGEAPAEEGSAEAAIQPIDEPILTEIAYRTYQISEFGMDSLFWIEGDDRAILLDTGTGTFDVKEYVAAHFGDKPYDVVLTHGHVDHAGGMFQFDEVYLNENDHELALGNTQEERKGYVEMMLSQSGGIYDLSPDMVIGGEDTKADAPKFLPLGEGDTFDLGNRTIEVYATPGHTAGGCSLLDRANRIMFTGDACNQNTLLTPFSGGEEEASDDQCVSGLKATAEKLLSMQGDFDRNVNGHVGYARFLTFISQSPEVIPECIALCDAILAGEVEGEESTGIGGKPVRIAQSKTGVMQIQYQDWQVK